MSEKNRSIRIKHTPGPSRPAPNHNDTGIANDLANLRQKLDDHHKSVDERFEEIERDLKTIKCFIGTMQTGIDAHVDTLGFRLQNESTKHGEAIREETTERENAIKKLCGLIEGLEAFEPLKKNGNTGVTKQTSGKGLE